MQNKIAHAQMTDRAAGFCEMHATIKNLCLLPSSSSYLLMQFDLLGIFPMVYFKKISIVVQFFVAKCSGTIFQYFRDHCA